MGRGKRAASLLLVLAARGAAGQTPGPEGPPAETPAAAPRRGLDAPPTPGRVAAARMALRCPLPEFRGFAEEYLARHVETAWRAVAEDLAAPEKGIRLAAVRILAGAPALGVRETLGRALLRDADPEVRLLLVVTLRDGAAGDPPDDPGPRDILLEALEREGTPVVQAGLLRALVGLEDPEPIPRLADLLHRAEGDLFRRELCRALIRLSGGIDFGDDPEAWRRWWRTRDPADSRPRGRRARGGEDPAPEEGPEPPGERRRGSRRTAR